MKEHTSVIRANIDGMLMLVEFIYYRGRGPTYDRRGLMSAPSEDDEIEIIRVTRYEDGPDLREVLDEDDRNNVLDDVWSAVERRYGRNN